MLAACGSAATALLLGDRRARLIAMAIALALAPVLVLGNVWDEPRVADFRGSSLQVVAAAVIGGTALAVLVTAFRRRPQLFPIAAVAVLPLRVPVEIGDETANLLVPLYLVIAAGFVTAAISDAAAASDERPAAAGVWLRRLLAATLVLYAIQATYSEDVANAIESIGFFLVPFAVMFALLVEIGWTRELLRGS